MHAETIKEIENIEKVFTAKLVDAGLKSRDVFEKMVREARRERMEELEKVLNAFGDWYSKQQKK